MSSAPDFLTEFPLVLASGSPRRAELLRQMGIWFEVIVSDEVEPEFDSSCGSPARFAERTARLKMDSVAARFEGRLILAADTLVVVDNVVLGKPGDAMEAEEMLFALAGRTHEVVTGVAVGCVGNEGSLSVVNHASTRVTFAPLDAATVRAYIATGEPMDKAGAYGIQGKGACLVSHIEGCHFNVVGLPIRLVTDMLEHFRITPARIWANKRLT